MALEHQKLVATPDYTVHDRANVHGPGDSLVASLTRSRRALPILNLVESVSNYPTSPGRYKVAALDALSTAQCVSLLPA
jgi:hypothetical protein